MKAIKTFQVHACRRLPALPFICCQGRRELQVHQERLARRGLRAFQGHQEHQGHRGHRVLKAYLAFQGRLA